MPLITTREAAEILGCSVSFVNNLIARKIILTHKTGRDNFLKPAEVRAYALSRKRGRPPKKKKPST